MDAKTFVETCIAGKVVVTLCTLKSAKRYDTRNNKWPTDFISALEDNDMCSIVVMDKNKDACEALRYMKHNGRISLMDVSSLFDAGLA